MKDVVRFTAYDKGLIPEELLASFDAGIFIPLPVHDMHWYTEEGIPLVELSHAELIPALKEPLKKGCVITLTPMAYKYLVERLGKDNDLIGDLTYLLSIMPFSSYYFTMELI